MYQVALVLALSMSSLSDNGEHRQRLPALNHTQKTDAAVFLHYYNTSKLFEACKPITRSVSATDYDGVLNGWLKKNRAAVERGEQVVRDKMTKNHLDFERGMQKEFGDVVTNLKRASPEGQVEACKHILDGQKAEL